MKKLLLFIGVLFWTITSVQSQTITLEEAYQLSKENYPLIKQQNLLERTKDYSVKNVWSDYYPQINIIGQATYQTDVMELPIEIPGQEFEPIDKDQYKAYAELNQVIYDGGVMSNREKIVKAEYDAQIQQLNVQLYKIKERVNDLYFGILLLDEKLAQLQLFKKDIQLTLKKVNAAIENGVALRSSGQVLEAELIKLDQNETEMRSAKASYLKMLSLLMNKELDSDTKLQRPSLEKFGMQIERPELQLFEAQKRTLDAQLGIIKAKNIPKIGLFAQGGYGKPGLNMLSNDWQAYAIGGVRLTIPISGFYNMNREMEIVSLQKQSIDAQRETFLLNTRLDVEQQSQQLQKYEALIEADEKLIELRETIKKSAEAQLEEGIINSSDYLRELNAEKQAQQDKILHELQMLMTLQKNKITIGN